jgi:hypothetical protein
MGSDASWTEAKEALIKELGCAEMAV